MNIKVSEDRCLLNTLIKASWLKNDRVTVRLPIQRDLLNILLKTTEKHFLNLGQVYLSRLYTALFSTAYYGLFRISKITESEHVVKVKDVHIGENKRKMLFVLPSSKMHTKGNFPQTIKISSLKKASNSRFAIDNPGIKSYCPYHTLHNYISVRERYRTISEPFFVSSNRSAVKPDHFRAVLKLVLKTAGYDYSYYSSHSFRSG